MDSLPPLRLERRYDSRIWGGSRLAAWLGASDAPSPLAEAWLVYDENTVAEGPLQGRTLADLSRDYGAALIGSVSLERYGASFPLLAKFIDAADHLSIQVHPDDAYAHANEAATGFHGKTEAWYVLHAEPDAVLTHGFNQPLDRAACAAAVAAGTLEGYVRRIPATPGTTVFVPAGTIHALNAGCMIFEIQQKSDLTYRLYDYGRPRPLQVERGLDVLDFTPNPPAVVAPVALTPERTLLVECPFFAMERCDLATPLAATTSPRSFEIWTVIEGALRLETAAAAPLRLGLGEAVVLPASLGDYTLTPEGAAVALRCYVP